MLVHETLLLQCENCIPERAITSIIYLLYRTTRSQCVLNDLLIEDCKYKGMF